MAARANAELIVIGLDSMEPLLLKEWADEGVLPVLQALRRRGLWADVNNLPGFGNGVFWPSLYTGVNPGHFGRYFVSQTLPGTYEQGTFLEDRDLGAEPFWRALSRAGKRVAVVDMVRAPLTPDLNGIQIADWTTHERSGAPRSWPAALIDEVIGRYGDDPFQGHTDAHDRSPEELAQLLEKLEQRVETKARMSRDYLAKGGWDMFLTVFGEPHDIGHTSWHVRDPSHPWHDPAVAARIGDPVKAIYQAVDAGVGQILEAAGPDATVVILSGPGMGPNYTANFLLDAILRRIEEPGRFKGDAIKSRKNVFKALYRRSVGPDLRRGLRRVFSRLGIDLAMDNPGQRRFYSVPHNEIAGAVRINLIGREPQGKVAPGDEFDEVCAALASDLMAITNLETGEPLVSRVVRTSEYCDGSHADAIPDLFVVWNRSAPIAAVGSPKIGELRGGLNSMRSGDHTRHGSILAAGPGIPAGVLPESFGPMDVTPTLAGLLGVALNDVEGTPIREITRDPAAA